MAYAYDPETCPGHPPASTLKACACRGCGAWVWEGIAMCPRPCEAAPVGPAHDAPEARRGTALVGDTGVCTRPLGHEGRCEERELRGGEAPT